MIVIDQPFTSPALSRDEKIRLLKELDEQQVKGCQKCRLSTTRTQTVFGEGDPDAPIFFIGEGPGETEDLTGRPFVGRAGNLLEKMIGGMGFKREQIFIANIVKCRPPGNRAPAADETAACMVLSEAIHVMLLTHDKWRTFTSKAIPDAHQSAQVMLALSSDSKAGVTELVEKAVAAGGKADPMPTQDLGFMFGRSFEDPDGHIWETMWMDMSAVPPSP